MPIRTLFLMLTINKRFLSFLFRPLIKTLVVDKWRIFLRILILDLAVIAKVVLLLVRVWEKEKATAGAQVWVRSPVVLRGDNEAHKQEVRIDLVSPLLSLPKERARENLRVIGPFRTLEALAG